MLRSRWTGPVSLAGAVLAVAALTVASADGALAAPASPSRAAESWVWPLDGPVEVTRPFAPGPTRYSPGHYGADLAAAAGTVVRAAGAGRVSYAGLLAGRGVVVVVHGALRTTYEPVAAAVRVGDVVAAGAPLGRVTAGHPSCGGTSCLHWGLRRGEDYLDPLRLVRAGPVRLLPLDGAGVGAAARGAAARSVTGAALSPAPLARAQPRLVPLPAASAQPRPSALPAASTLPAPDWSLRAADAPLASLALLALLAGLVLVRTSPRPAAPPRAGHPAAGGDVAPPEDDPEPAPAPAQPATVDLDDERRRRRPGA